MSDHLEPPPKRRRGTPVGVGTGESLAAEMSVRAQSVDGAVSPALDSSSPESVDRQENTRVRMPATETGSKRGSKRRTSARQSADTALSNQLQDLALQDIQQRQGTALTSETVSTDKQDRVEETNHIASDNAAIDDAPADAPLSPQSRTDDDGGSSDADQNDDSPEPPHHRWVYVALALFVLSLGFGAWGVWTAWFADRGSAEDLTKLRSEREEHTQQISTLRRSDQISREANRDLQRTLAERDEEISGLRADVAFYERFVGATGQRRGLSVHDLEMSLQNGDVWHFVATLTQNLNRGAVNNGRLTLSVEGTRNDRLERLSWSSLRKQNNAPGLGYSFKYFQQMEGEVMLPKDFKPVRVTVRLVPAGGSAVEQSFPWPQIVDGRSGGG